MLKNGNERDARSETLLTMDSDPPKGYRLLAILEKNKAEANI